MTLKPVLMLGFTLGAAACSKKNCKTLPSVALLALAAFKTARVVVHEEVGAWIREPVCEVHPDLAQLVSCTRCAGTWAAGALVALNLFAPKTGKILTTALAVAAANDFLQAGFSGAKDWANTQAERSAT